MRRHLGVRLTVLILVLTFVPLLLAGSFFTWQSFQIQEDHAYDLQHEVVERAATQLQTFFETADNELRLIIQIPDFKEADRPRQEAVLSQSIFYKNIFDQLTLLDANGQEEAQVSRLGVTPAADLVSRATQPVFISPMQTNKTYYGPITFSSVSREPLITMSVPTIDARSGQPNGVLVGEVRLRQVFDRVSNIRFNETGKVYIVGTNGAIVAHSQADLIGTAFNLDLNIAPVGDYLEFGDSQSAAVHTAKPLILGQQRMFVIAEMTSQEAYGPAFQNALITAVVALLVSLIGGLCTVLVVRQIVRPVEQLAKVAQTISEGDLNQPIPVTLNDEIGTLQRNFNQMVTNLREQRSAIEQRTHELETSMETQQQLFRTVEALSSPMLPVWEGVVVVPIVGYVDQKRGQILIESTLRGVVRQRAQVAVIDITGLAVVDTQVIQLIIQLIRAIELLGVEALVAGISATTAQIIVDQGIDLTGLRTHRDLRTAVEAAVSQFEAPARPTMTTGLPADHRPRSGHQTHNG